MINIRKIALTPEIGDWTEYKPEDSKNEVVVGSVGVSNFDRLSSEELDFALKIHYDLAQSIANQLRDQLKIKVDLYYIEVVQQSYKKFKEYIDENNYHLSVKAKNKYNFGLYLDSLLADILVDRSVGGEGKKTDEELTNIEESVLENVAKELIMPLKSSWECVNDSDFEIRELLKGSVNDVALTDNSSYLSFKIKLSIGDNNPNYFILGYCRDSILAFIKNIRKKKLEKKNNIDSKIEITA